MTKRISAEFRFSPDSLIRARGESSHPVLFMLSNINNLKLRAAGTRIHFKHMLLLAADVLLTKRRLHFSAWYFPHSP